MRRSPRRPCPIEPGAADALRAEHFTAVHRAREAVTGAANAGDYRFRLASGSDKLDPQECRFPWRLLRKAAGRPTGLRRCGCVAELLGVRSRAGVSAAAESG